MKPINRVEQIIKHKNLSISGFEKTTGLSNNSIQTAIKRNSNLKDETLNTILSTFPEISAEWLLTGNGIMLNGSSNNSNNFPKEDVKSLIRYLIDNNEKLIKDDLFKKYIEGNIRLLQLDEEKTKYEEEMQKLKEVILKKKQNN
ncbi:hypothetical protein [Aquimarina algiphila]|uniref:hypothetical protein n=1 Tax=Aquimarina algiphila TaxID=2047982 RepID=UPI00232A858B|nr:hypothetical protein [Aquimarina algiphila]